MIPRRLVRAWIAAEPDRRRQANTREYAQGSNGRNECSALKVDRWLVVCEQLARRVLTAVRRGDHQKRQVIVDAVGQDRRQQISLAYLEQLFARLRRAGLVESERGRSGGYRLGRDAASISVAEILAAVEEGVRMTRCRGENAAPCMAGQRCLTHGLWDALGEQITAFLENVTLREVIDGIPPSKQAPRIADPSIRAIAE